MPHAHLRILITEASRRKRKFKRHLQHIPSDDQHAYLGTDCTATCIQNVLLDMHPYHARIQLYHDRLRGSLYWQTLCVVSGILASKGGGRKARIEGAVQYHLVCSMLIGMLLLDIHPIMLWFNCTTID